MLAMRKIILSIMSCLALASGAFMAVAPLPASAATSHLFEEFHSSTYVGTSGTALYSQAVTVSSPGRDFTIIDTGWNTLGAIGDSSPAICQSGCEIYQLKTNAGFCLATNNSFTTVELRDCSTLNSGVNHYDFWANTAGNFNDTWWVNMKQTLDSTSTAALSAPSSTGLNVVTCDPNGQFATCPSGYYSKWSVN